MTRRPSKEEVASPSNTTEVERYVRETFDLDIRFVRWQPTSAGGRTPVLVDQETGLEWLVIPAGKFELGLTDREVEQVHALTKQPFLTIDELKPTKLVHMSSYLMTVAPISAAMVQGDADDTVGPRDTYLCDYSTAEQLAERFDSALPTECEWEYACRGGSQTLFWFGDKILRKAAMETILGLKTPESPNGFGLISLFFGEWCADFWRSDHGSQTPKDADAGHVIRGGAARFWPWHDSREWAGCASAFRMSEKDADGAGVAVRLVRRV